MPALYLNKQAICIWLAIQTSIVNMQRAYCMTCLQVTALRQQLKLSNAKAQTAESKYATHAGGMATLQGRAEVAEKSAHHAQASLTKLQVRFA